VNVVLEHATVMSGDVARVRALAFRDGRVADATPDAYRLDLGDHVILPGLINAHDHLQLNCIPPLPHATPFANSYEWIDAMSEHRRRPEVISAVSEPIGDRYWQGALKNLLAGTTTVAHHDPWNAVFDDADFPVSVLRDFGWSHSLGLGAPSSGTTTYGPAVRDSFCATPPSQPWIIHLAEGLDEVASEELTRLDALGCLAANSVLVHGVGLTVGDIARIIERDASVVWCPASNVELFGRTLAPRPLHGAGRLALGTDSRLTGARDLLDELRIAAATSDLSPRELLALVTARAAAILRIDDRGGLEKGQRGDCVIIRASDDPHAALTGSSRRGIRAVVRNGLPAVADPDFAPWFAQCGIDTVAVKVDGAAKLLARRFARPGAIALEPGLELA
jgi:cytosine/adenosine deaminase-related metal-dependent hydrolase